MMGKYQYEDETYEIIGAAMDVHKELGCGFLEAVYQEALGIELEDRGVTFEMEKELNIEYKGRVLDKKYYADFLCNEKIVLEIKATSELVSKDEAQIINYLNATKMKVGLLINFGESSLEYKRFVN